MFGWGGFRIFAYCAVGALAAAALLQIYLFDASEEAVSRSMRYDVSWMGANGRIEAAHLEKFAARFAALGSDADANKTRLFYDIILSRLETWGSGGFKLFLDQDPRRRARFEQLGSMIDSIGVDVARLDNPEARKKLLSVLERAAPILDRIGSEAHTVSVSEAAVVRDDIGRRQFHQRLVILALLAGAAALIGLVTLQNTSLRRAKATAEKSAADFAYLALHDPLTGLPNRTAFDDHFRAALGRQAYGCKIAAFALDLDGFKAINDLLGHPAGDALLAGVARRLEDWAIGLSANSMVSRSGGDEFLILLEMDHSDCAIHAADNLLRQFKMPIETSYGNVAIGATVGFAATRAGVPASQDLLLDADLALTEAKARGKGRVLQFEPKLRTNLQRRQRIEADIAGAVDQGQIEPYYQMQIDLATGRITGFEALARWSHPELGWISPAEFIPIAESCGDVVGLGKSILKTACHHASLLPPELSVSVNLSVVQLHSAQLIREVADVLKESGLAPNRLTLEVTESIMISDTAKVVSRLNELKQLGVAIALDDFGTGYSALSYLTKFEWNELKIDRSFTQAAQHHPMNWTIIRTVNILAKKIGARVVAEGIETKEQEAALAKIGCDIGQGFLFGRPLPFDELPAAMLQSMSNSHTARNTRDPDTPKRRSIG